VRRDENRWRALIDQRQDLAGWLEAQGARQLKLTPVTLEDLFVALVRTRRPHEVDSNRLSEALVVGVVAGGRHSGVVVHGRQFEILVLFTIFTGAFLLQIDLQRGHTRVLRALPVTAKQFARAWWLVSVGLPALFLAAITGLAMHHHAAWRAPKTFLGPLFRSLPYTDVLARRNVLCPDWSECQAAGGFADYARSIFFGALWVFNRRSDLVWKTGLSGNRETHRSSDGGGDDGCRLVPCGTLGLVRCWDSRRFTRPRRNRIYHDARRGFGGLPVAGVGGVRPLPVHRLSTMAVIVVISLASGYAATKAIFIKQIQQGDFSGHSFSR